MSHTKPLKELKETDISHIQDSKSTHYDPRGRINVNPLTKTP